MRAWSIAPLVVLALGGAARAEDAPPRKPPGLTLDRGAANVTVTLEANLAEDRVAKPLSIAPDVSYGVTDDLTLVLVHSTFATTGFRGNAGAGLCVTGDEGGCAHAYDNVGLDAIHGLRRGPFSFAVVAGAHFVSLDPAWFDLRAGARLRWTGGKLLVTFSPSVFFALSGRDDGNKETLWAPVFIGAKPIPPLTLGLGTGIKGPVEDFGDTWTFALVPSAQLAVTRRLALGASFALPKLLGAGAIPSEQKGFNVRFAQAWVSWTL
jgi:hypothetical protein